MPITPEQRIRLNLNLVGKKPMLGRKLSKLTKLKMRRAHLGRKQSDENKLKRVNTIRAKKGLPPLTELIPKEPKRKLSSLERSAITSRAMKKVKMLQKGEIPFKDQVEKGELPFTTIDDKE